MFIESFAISSFLRNHDDLTAFCVLTHHSRYRPWSDISPEEIAKLPAQERQTQLTTNSLADTGKVIAGNLAIVYLVSIMEAYVKDVAYELLNKNGWNERKVRKVLEHYESQTEDEAVAEDKATFELKDQAVMVVPKKLVSKITRLIEQQRPRPRRATRA